MLFQYLTIEKTILMVAITHLTLNKNHGVKCKFCPSVFRKKILNTIGKSYKNSMWYKPDVEKNLNKDKKLSIIPINQI